MKLAACVEYNGTHYCGWQRLSQADSVQVCVEKALSKVADEPIQVVCAGRTDSGVHASGQVLHFETQAERPLKGWLFGSNIHLPDTIALRWIQPVADEFHARFSATARRYRYIILNRQARPALLSGRVTWYQYPLDVERMHEAAQALLGEQDFSSFRAAGCQSRHARRRVSEVTMSRAGEYVYLDIVANAFLHHMVRNIVGALIFIGNHKRPVSWIGELLAARDRTLAGPTAAAAGLYLVHADYPEHFALPDDYVLPSLQL